MGQSKKPMVGPPPGGPESSAGAIRENLGGVGEGSNFRLQFRDTDF